MNEPESFGLSVIQTLAHVGEPTRSVRHGSFWKTWMSGVMSERPRLVSRDHASSDPSDPSATHEFVGCRHVRIGCSLLMPDRQKPRGAIVALHGYENVPSLVRSAEDWAPMIARGMAVLVLRVRGYAGSSADVPQLVHHAGHKGGGDWITYGLEAPISDRGYGCEWSLSYAVSDVMNACRALRTRLDAPACDRPIFLFGESFGAALAILAASQMADINEPARLAIGLPSMGDWPWRLSLSERVAGGGAGGRIRRFIDRHANLAAEMTSTLRVFDTVIHARRVACPVLCKLAGRDDVVPAPSAAAVFNSLGSDPGAKWRYVTQYGHFDGGLTDLRRHAQFERIAADFLDASLSIDDAMAPWERVMTSGDIRSLR